MTRPASQKPRLFNNKSKKGLSTEELNAMTQRERDIEMDRYEAYLHKLNRENGIGVEEDENGEGFQE